MVDLQRWVEGRRRPDPGRPRTVSTSDRPPLVELLGLDLARHIKSDCTTEGRRLLDQAREVIEHRLRATLGPLLTPADWQALERARLSPAEALAMLRRGIPHVDAVVTELVDELRRDLDVWVETVRRGRRREATDPAPPGFFWPRDE